MFAATAFNRWNCGKKGEKGLTYLVSLTDIRIIILFLFSLSVCKLRIHRIWWLLGFRPILFLPFGCCHFDYISFFKLIIPPCYFIPFAYISIATVLNWNHVQRSWTCLGLFNEDSFNLQLSLIVFNGILVLATVALCESAFQITRYYLFNYLMNFSILLTVFISGYFNYLGQKVQSDFHQRMMEKV